LRGDPEELNDDATVAVRFSVAVEETAKFVDVQVDRRCLDAWGVCAVTFGWSPARVNCQHSALDECCCSDQIWGSALKTESLKSEWSVEMPAAGSVMLFRGWVKVGSPDSGRHSPFYRNYIWISGPVWPLNSLYYD